jgi:autotransporter-associated beta strand protein
MCNHDPYTVNGQRFTAHRLLLSFAACTILAIGLIAPQFASALDSSWTGATDTVYATNGNWTANKPGASDNAVFNGTFSNQPSMTNNQTVGGVWMTGSVGQNVTISGGSQLTLAGNTINLTPNLGILIDNANSFTLTINADLKINAALALTNNSGNLFTIGGALDTNGKATTFNGSGNTTVTGIISGGGDLTKAGGGTLTFSGVNTYNGVTTISGGILSVATIGNGGVAGNLGKATSNAGNIVFDGGSLQYTGATASTDRNFTINAGKTATIDVTTNNLTISGASTNTTGALTKIGAGTLTLSGANLYTGLTTVSAGTLAYGANNVISTGGITVNGATAVLDLGASHTDTVGTVTLAGGGNITGTGTSALTSTGTFEMQSGSASAILAGSGIVLNKTTSGTVTLSGANTYTGGSNINGGTLNVGSSGALGSSGTISFGGGTLQYSASNTTDYSNRFSTAASQAYSIDTNGQNVTYATALTSSGGTLSKTGSGTLTLTGTNTFNGATTVSGGTLLLSGSSGAALGSTSSITVNSGGTLQLGANDQINNSATMTLAGGTVAKGNFNEGTTGAAGIGALTLSAAGSHLDFGTGTVGVLSFVSLNASTFTLTIDNWTGTPYQVGSGSTDRLIFDVDQTANLSAFVFTSYGAGALQIDLGNGFFEIVAVPEPGTWAGGALAFAVVFVEVARRKLRRRREHVRRFA